MEALQMYWHIHHNVLAEFAIEPIEERIAFIKAEKPIEQMETRLRLMRPVRHELSGPAFEAALIYYNSMSALKKTKPDKHGRELASKLRKIVNEALIGYHEHRGTFYEELEVLHKLECPDCPWDGETIFPSTT